jgi:hypothetical protein
MPKFALALAATAVAVALLGCGGGESGSPEDEVTEAIENYNTAAAEKEGAAACALLTPAGQHMAARQHGYEGTLGVEGPNETPTCEDGIENRYGDEKFFQAMKFAKVTDVQVRGEEAKADLEVEGLHEIAELVEEGGEWKLQKPLPPVRQ